MSLIFKQRKTYESEDYILPVYPANCTSTIASHKSLEWLIYKILSIVSWINSSLVCPLTSTLSASKMWIPFPDFIVIKRY